MEIALGSRHRQLGRGVLDLGRHARLEERVEPGQDVAVPGLEGLVPLLPVLREERPDRLGLLLALDRDRLLLPVLERELDDGLRVDAVRVMVRRLHVGDRVHRVEPQLRRRRLDEHHREEVGPRRVRQPALERDPSCQPQPGRDADERDAAVEGDRVLVLERVVRVAELPRSGKREGPGGAEAEEDPGEDGEAERRSGLEDDRRPPSGDGLDEAAAAGFGQSIEVDAADRAHGRIFVGAPSGGKAR